MKARKKKVPAPDLAKDPAEYHHGNLRQALVETGLLLIREQGLDALSLREAARKAGVSEAAPYRHFSNKESLLAAIAADGFLKLHEKLERAGTPGSSPVDLLQARAWAYVEFALEETDHFQTMYTSSLTPPHAKKHPELVQTGMRPIESVIAVINECKKDGSIYPEADSQSAAIQLLSAIHGLTMLLVGHQMEAFGVTPAKARPVVRGLIDTVLGGLRHPPR
jgi:AcrR family transcriptional regulator